MKYAVRPSKPQDAPAIIALLNAAGLHPHVLPAHLHWKYWQQRADWPGPRSFVLANGKAPIAHGAIIPASYVWGTRRIRMLHIIDWAAYPEEIGAGVVLMKHIAQQAGALLAIGGSSQTLKVLPHIGFRAVGVATGYARALHPLRLLRAEQGSWRLLPRFARSVASALAARAARSGGWLASRVAVGDVNRISSVFPSPARGMTVLERSVDLFSYVLSCPIAPMDLYSVERAGRIRGYFLLASVPGQIRIADCWMDSDEPADWRAMIHCAVEQAKHDSQAAEVVIWVSDPLLAEALRECGFRARQETLIQMRSAQDDAMPPAPLRVQMLDNDAAYLYEGRAELWT